MFPVPNGLGESLPELSLTRRSTTAQRAQASRGYGLQDSRRVLPVKANATWTIWATFLQPTLLFMFDDSTIFPPWIIPAGATAAVIAPTRCFRSRGSPNQSTFLYPSGPKGLRACHYSGTCWTFLVARQSGRDSHKWLRPIVRQWFPLFGAFTITSPYVETGTIHLNIIGTDLVVLSSSEAIVELLDKKSAIY